MDFQQPHGGYMRPPPPPPTMAGDPYYHHQAQRPPLPPPNPWYSTQFQFQHASSPSPPPPPPPPAHVQPPHQQWPPPPPPPPHSDQFVPPHPPYPTPPPYSVPPNQYPHPHASLPPRPPHMPSQSHHVPQSYPQVNQEWGPANWGHHQSWEYQANNNEEVWAAKARAWAASKVASDNQQSQHLAYGFKDGSVAGDSTATFSGRDSSISPSVLQQEVPSSYSSIAGNPVRGIEHVAAVPPDYNFVPPAEPALVYPPVPTMLPAGLQVDPAVTVPSPVPGHTAPMFGRIAGPSFQPTVSSVAAPFGIVAGPELHPGTTFSGDSFGVPFASERPKKASVPNWLREEIIKNKPVIVSSAAELPKEDSQSIEDEGVDNSSGKVDQKSIDSPRSTEDEDDDEDDLEAARMAAINQEIKRVLTDVLLKVTDELFDEIATKVLSEDDPTIEVDNGVSSDNKVPTSTQNIETPKASAKILLPAKTKETISYDASEKLNSSPGDVLGLGSYASDDESEIESSGKPSFKEKNSLQESTSSKGMDVVDNGGSTEKTEEHCDNLESDLGSGNLNAPTVNHDVALIELKNEGAANTSNAQSGVAECELDNDGTSKVKKNPGANGAGKSEKPVENHISGKSVMDGSRSPETRDKLDKNGRREHERNSAGKNYNLKELEISKESAYERGEEAHSRNDEKHTKKERRDDQNGAKERGRDKGIKSAERAKDSDSRKRLSPDNAKDSRRDRQTDRRTVVKEENDGKRERTKDDKREKPRHRNSSESSRHKRRRSSSVSSRDRDQKDRGHASDLSDESSDDSKRKLHSRRRKSPSPVRSRKRHVSRSPHSKHSQRRHSPYSSLETSRGRRSRSRSRSPMRRRR